MKSKLLLQVFLILFMLSGIASCDSKERLSDDPVDYNEYFYQRWWEFWVKAYDTPFYKLFFRDNGEVMIVGQFIGTVSGIMDYKITGKELELSRKAGKPIEGFIYSRFEGRWYVVNHVKDTVYLERYSIIEEDPEDGSLTEEILNKPEQIRLVLSQE